MIKAEMQKRIAALEETNAALLKAVGELSAALTRSLAAGQPLSTCQPCGASPMWQVDPPPFWPNTTIGFTPIHPATTTCAVSVLSGLTTIPGGR
jgi:hypothetical protein